ncbi:MAG: hypothetical protein FJY92_04670, partial [Candidatus Hydrogenedentes bacterium]|nr:hypothetical protein [Candidatus Hydrogenedentota bacterium]
AVSLEIEAGRTYDNVDFAVERGAEITGRVTYAQGGDPIVNASVFAIPSQMVRSALRRMSTGAMNDIGPNQTRTNENGEFALRGLEFDSEYRAVARTNGLAPGSSEMLQLDPGEPAPHVEIVLVRGSNVSGTVRYTDGTPAGGAELLLFPDSGEGWNTFIGPYPTRADDTGAFKIENVAIGAYWLRAEGDFGGGMIGRATAAQNKAARVETDGVNDVTGIDMVIAKGTPKSVTPPAQGSIKGTVVGVDGTPVAEARVEGRMVGNPAMNYGATTGADGTFELNELRGPVFDLSVSADEGIAKQAAVPVGTNVTLRLTPPASLSGRVVDTAGDPVPGCSVRLTNQDDAGKVASFISVMQNMFGAQPGGQSTNADGAFEFAKLAPGRYVVRANSASRGTAETSPLTVAAGQDVTGVEIRLNAGVTISGTVVGPSGELVRGATVQLGPVTQDTAANLVSAFIPAGVMKTAGTTTTGEDGAFTLNQVAPGTYRLTASHSDYAKSIESNFTVDAGHDITAYRIVLGKGGEARGTFAIDGKPQPGAMIVMLGEAGVELVQTDSQGRFDVRGLTAGPHMIAAFDPARIASGGAGMQFSPQVVDIPDGSAANTPDNPAANITLGGHEGVKVAGTIAGGDLGTFTLVALRKPGGPALADLDLTNFSNLLESMRSLGSQTLVGPDGAFSMENVPPGDYTLEVYTMNFDESNPDISALLNLPRTPAYSHPVDIGPDQPPLQIDLSSP